MLRGWTRRHQEPGGQTPVSPEVSKMRPSLLVSFGETKDEQACVCPRKIGRLAEDSLESKPRTARKVAKLTARIPSESPRPFSVLD